MIKHVINKSAVYPLIRHTNIWPRKPSVFTNAVHVSWWLGWNLLRAKVFGSLSEVVVILYRVVCAGMWGSGFCYFMKTSEFCQRIKLGRFHYQKYLLSGAWVRLLTVLNVETVKYIVWRSYTREHKALVIIHATYSSKIATVRIT